MPTILFFIIVLDSRAFTMLFPNGVFAQLTNLLSTKYGTYYLHNSRAKFKIKNYFNRSAAPYWQCHVGFFEKPHGFQKALS